MTDREQERAAVVGEGDLLSELSRNPFMRLYMAFAVSPAYDGPLAEDFHKMVARKYLKGMRGGHTSLGPCANQPDLVREQLALDWDMSNGTTYRVRNIDRGHCLDRLAGKWAALKRLWKRNPYRYEGSAVYD